MMDLLIPNLPISPICSKFADTKSSGNGEINMQQIGKYVANGGDSKSPNMQQIDRKSPHQLQNMQQMVEIGEIGKYVASVKNMQQMVRFGCRSPECKGIPLVFRSRNEQDIIVWDRLRCPFGTLFQSLLVPSRLSLVASQLPPLAERAHCGTHHPSPQERCARNCTSIHTRQGLSCPRAGLYFRQNTLLFNN